MADVGTVSDGTARAVHKGLNFTDVVASGDKLPGSSLKSQNVVDSHFGTSTVSKNHIEFAGIQIIPMWNNGCAFVHGGNAEAEIARQKYDATIAMNQETPAGAERAHPGKEQQTADQLAHHLLAPESEYSEFPDDKATKMRDLFKNLSREETERVINSLNDKFADSGFRFAQTADGGVWFGQKNDAGTYEPQTIMRYPECMQS